MSTAPYGLSSREMDVLRCFVRGLGRKQVAAELYLSQGTVAVHIRGIYDKLDVTSSLQAATKWIREQELPALTRQAYEAGYRARQRDESKS